MFKIGDKVKCIKKSQFSHYNDVGIGEIVTIRESGPIGLKFVGIAEESGKGYYSEGRFELYNELDGLFYEGAT